MAALIGKQPKNANEKKQLSARVEKRLKWWKEHRQKDENTEKKKEKDQKEKETTTSSPKKKKLKTSHDDEHTESEPQAVSTDDTIHVVSTKAVQEKGKKKQKQFVLFVGNLPYTITKEDLQAHFNKESGGVKAVRFLTDKNTGQPRGFAYVEFEHARGFKQALRLHHTDLGGRKINVEFTTIGGKTDKRKQKLQKMNKTLAKFKIPINVETTKSKQHKSAHWKKGRQRGGYRGGRKQ